MQNCHSFGRIQKKLYLFQPLFERDPTPKARSRRSRRSRRAQDVTIPSFRNMHDLSARIPSLQTMGAVGAHFQIMALMKRANFHGAGTSELSLHNCRRGTFRAFSDQPTLPQPSP
ncbi:hypothetical protein M3J09_007773 [Ascochyta lentis]